MMRVCAGSWQPGNEGQHAPFGPPGQLCARGGSCGRKGLSSRERSETPVGSLFVVEAKDRAAIDAFTRSDPYHVHGVWARIDVHYYRKKR